MELKDFLNSINNNKKDLISEDPLCEKDYLPFVTNRCLSYFLDTVFYVNEMNGKSFLSKKMQYDYLRQKITKKSRFSKWHKNEANGDIDLIKEYYGYSTQKAKQIRHLISDAELTLIKEKSFKGGQKTRNPK